MKSLYDTVSESVFSRRPALWVIGLKEIAALIGEASAMSQGTSKERATIIPGLPSHLDPHEIALCDALFFIGQTLREIAENRKDPYHGELFKRISQARTLTDAIDEKWFNDVIMPRLDDFNNEHRMHISKDVVEEERKHLLGRIDAWIQWRQKHSASDTPILR